MARAFLDFTALFFFAPDFFAAGRIFVARFAVVTFLPAIPLDFVTFLLFLLAPMDAV